MCLYPYQTTKWLLHKAYGSLPLCVCLSCWFVHHLQDGGLYDVTWNGRIANLSTSSTCSLFVITGGDGRHTRVCPSSHNHTPR